MSIADRICRNMHLLDGEVLSVEGIHISDWVIVDLGEIIVHVIQEDTRRLCALEYLWTQ